MKPSTDEEMVNVQEFVKKYEEEHQAHQQSSQCTQSSPTKIILLAENESMKTELAKKEEALNYQKFCYTVSNVSEETLRMETGLPTKEIFDIVVKYAESFKDAIVYYYGWEVKCISFEDQVFITLMKMKQNYTNLHLAQLFSCSVSTISNIVITFLNVLHSILFKDIMTEIPSRLKNSVCLPKSFGEYTSCRIIIDCTDIEVAKPSLMSEQRATYSTYRGMNSYKVIIGVAPNAVITFVSELYPGSISDKEIVKQSGILDQMEVGDLILADKGFLIQDLLPAGVSLNIPPFLEHGKFTESEVKLTRKIASCRIHVERANARLKDFKILTFIPSYLRNHANKLIQLCAALVNLQFPLIKDGCQSTDFD